jgi:putative ABC transport system permease protein
MDLWAVIRVALSMLGRNKLRSVLTMGGITIGISAVICSVAIGDGAAKRTQDQLQNLGDNMIWIEAGSRNLQGYRTGTRGTKTLSEGDAKAIQQSVALIKSMSPNVDGHIQVVYGNQNWSTMYRGVAPEYLAIRRWFLAAGVTFTQQETDNLANVCLLGQTVVEQLFGNEDPLGKTIRVGGLPCRVIGTLQAKGLSTSGWDQDDFVMMPYKTVQHKIRGVDWLDDIFCSAASPQAILPAQEQIARLLRQRHHLRPDEDDDFNIRHPEELLQAQEDVNRTFTFMIASIAAVSLLVGGIGIMNIMLVSVTERTREIGVRMAVGATERDVQVQFLSEAVVLSLLGGGLGVMIGILSATEFSSVLGWPTMVSPAALVIAVLFSLGTGIFFGYYPAQKAARLDPIEALRYE